MSWVDELDSIEQTEIYRNNGYIPEYFVVNEDESGEISLRDPKTDESVIVELFTKEEVDTIKLNFGITPEDSGI